jgi:hypothetical protein
VCNFSNTTTPDKASGYMDHLKEEAINIKLHPRNFSRDGGFNPNQSSHPLNDRAVSKTPISRQDQA